MQASQPTLEGLPLEIRQQIYHIMSTGDLQSKIVKLSLAKITGQQNKYKLVSHGLDAIRSLVLTNRLLSGEVLDYCFEKLTFCLTDKTHSARHIIREFYHQIGPYNRKLIHHIILPHLSIDRAFGSLLHHRKLDFEDEQTARGVYVQQIRNLRSAMVLLTRFSGLKELDAGLDIVECFPQPDAEPRWTKLPDCIRARNAIDRGKEV
jgi:hypothetical protein